MEAVSEVWTTLRRMNPRMLLTQVVQLGLIVTSALMLWKSLILFTGSESPVVVVLSGSMEPGFMRGDILFLNLGHAPFRTGEIVVFNIDGRDIPIVHRVLKVHEKPDGQVDILTKKPDGQVDIMTKKPDGQVDIMTKKPDGQVDIMTKKPDGQVDIMTKKPDGQVDIMTKKPDGQVDIMTKKPDGQVDIMTKKPDGQVDILTKKPDGQVDILTKAMIAPCDDRSLYAKGQEWLNKKHIMGRAVGDNEHSNVREGLPQWYLSRVPNHRYGPRLQENLLSHLSQANSSQANSPPHASSISKGTPPIPSHSQPVDTMGCGASQENLLSHLSQANSSQANSPPHASSISKGTPPIPSHSQPVDTMGCGASQVPGAPQGSAAMHGLLADYPKPPVKVTERGVKFGYFLKLKELGCVDGEWTIQEVVERFVRPKTAVTKCCLFDVIPETYTGQPRFFISHTWSRKLKDLLALLQSHFVEGKDDDTLLWLDIVAINQRPYEDKGCLLQDDVASLASVVQATEQTLFCLDEQCVVLTRIWCLYEVWQTFLAKGVSGLMVLMPDVNGTRLEEVFETFDVMQAQATQPEDKKRILHQIKDSIGSTEVNLQLKAALVNSAQYAVDNTLKTGEDLVILLGKGGTLCRAIGQYKKAESMYQRALDARKCVSGADHPDTIDSINNLAVCIQEQGRNQEAEPMHQQALEARKRVLGADHPDTIASINNLANCIRDQGRNQEAEPMFQQALEATKRVLGSDHPDTIISINNLAICINAQGRNQEAEQMYQEALEARKRVLGADHPSTIASINNLAICINNQGRSQEAEPMYQQALEAKKRVLGPDHPSTIDSINILAICINAQGRNQEAEQMYQQALEARKRVLGADHPSTIASINDLATCIRDQGRYQEAEPMYQQSLEARKRVLGADHPHTINSIVSLAYCMQALGRYKKAEPLWQQLLEAKKRVLGTDHAATGDSMYSLACCIKAQGRIKEAQAWFSSAADIYTRVYGPEHKETLDALSKAHAD
eukprot:gene15437-21524_t